MFSLFIYLQISLCIYLFSDNVRGIYLLLPFSVSTHICFDRQMYMYIYIFLNIKKN